MVLHKIRPWVDRQPHSAFDLDHPYLETQNDYDVKIFSKRRKKNRKKLGKIREVWTSVDYCGKFCKQCGKRKNAHHWLCDECWEKKNKKG